MLKKLILILLTLSISPLWAKGPSETQVRDKAFQFLVDFGSGTIGDRTIQSILDDMKSKGSSKNVKEIVEYPEGIQTRAYLLSVGTHTIKINGYGSFILSDPIFRTSRRLGVGSPISAFESLCGSGVADYNEAAQVVIFSGKPGSGCDFTITVDEKEYQNPATRNQTKAKSIYVRYRAR